MSESTFGSNLVPASFLAASESATKAYEPGTATTVAYATGKTEKGSADAKTQLVSAEKSPGNKTVLLSGEIKLVAGKTVAAKGEVATAPAGARPTADRFLSVGGTLVLKVEKTTGIIVTETEWKGGGVESALLTGLSYQL